MLILSQQRYKTFWFQGYRFESGIAIFALKVIQNYVYSPFKALNSTNLKFTNSVFS